MEGQRDRETERVCVWEREVLEGWHETGRDQKYSWPRHRLEAKHVIMWQQLQGHLQHYWTLYSSHTASCSQSPLSFLCPLSLAVSLSLIWTLNYFKYFWICLRVLLPSSLFLFLCFCFLLHSLLRSLLISHFSSVPFCLLSFYIHVLATLHPSALPWCLSF